MQNSDYNSLQQWIPSFNLYFAQNRYTVKADYSDVQLVSRQCVTTIIGLDYNQITQSGEPSDPIGITFRCYGDKCNTVKSLMRTFIVNV